MQTRNWFTALLLFVICVVPLGMLSSIPRRHEDYAPEHAVQAEVVRDGDLVHIANVRSFVHHADSTFAERYVTRSYHVPSLRRVWFGLSPFAGWRGPAHAFLSFEFTDSRFVAISVEARKQQGESYSPLGGMLRRYELMMVIGEEPDVIGLRTSVWGDPVYLYPGRATPEQAQRLFLALLARSESLRREPEYYHTALNNCATNLAAAVNEVAAGRLGWHHSFLLPGYSDTYAWEQGLLAIGGPPERVRQAYLINERARGVVGRADFSSYIRAAQPPPVLLP